jgi:superfamily I DNA/RNA helicase
VDEVIQKIESIFTDDKTTPGIMLSSVHKSKGLEARRVFILLPEEAPMPHPMSKTSWGREQEMNLKYVAITRAIEELVWVS